MRLTLKYFASLREALGTGGPLEWTPDAEPTWAGSTAFITAAVSGATLSARPQAMTASAGRRSVT